jgi:hypothetical protein
VFEARQQQFGSYQTVRELNQVGTATIHSARNASENSAGGPPTRAVKVIHMPAFVAPEEARRRIGAFMERAGAQRRLATGNGSAPSGAPHWAPVYEGPTQTPDGAFYVTDLYPRSCDALVDGRRGSVSGPELWAIVQQAIAGLDELKASEQRAHGNLKPGNVLLSGRGPKLRAFLTDPGDAAAASEAADCRALGALIHQLVLHAPAPDDLRGELPAKPQWHALGLQGQAWRTFCGRLLGGGADPIASYARLESAIEELRPRTNPVWRRVAVVVGSVLLLAVAGGAVASKRSAYNVRDLDQLRAQWAPFEQVQQSKDAWNEQLKPYMGYASAADQERIGAIVAAICKVKPPQSIQLGLLHWNAQSRIESDLALIAHDIDPKIAEFSDRLHVPPDAARNAPVAFLTELPLRIGWADRLERSKGDVRLLDAAVRGHPQVDPVPATLLATIHKDQTTTPDFTHHPLDVEAAMKRLDAFHALAPRLASIVGGHYDFALMAREANGQLPASGSDPAQVVQAARAWADRAEPYRLVDPDPREPAALRQRLGALAARVSALGTSGKPGELHDQLDKLTRDVDDWLNSPVHEREKLAAIQRASTYRTALDQIAAEVQKDLSDPQTREALLHNSLVKIRIERLQAFVRDNGKPLLDRIPSDPDHAAELHERFVKMTDAVIEASNKLDPQFGPDANPILFDPKPFGPLLPGTATWLNALNAFGAVRRDALLGGALPSSLPDATELRKTLDDIVGRWTTWRDQTQRLIADAVALQRPISAAGGMYPPGQAPAGSLPLADWPKRYSQWLATLPVGGRTAPPAALKDDPLAAIETPDASRTIGSTNPAEAGLVLAAWQAVHRQLAGAGGAPISIDEDFAAWQRLRGWADQAADVTRRAALVTELKQQLVQHWTAWGAHPTTQLKLSDAAPELQYDGAMYNLLRLAKDNASSEADVEAAVRNVIARARAIKQPNVASSLDAILNDHAADPSRIAGWGPGGSRWRMAVQSNGRVRFTSPKDQRIAIDFARIDAPDGNGTYLSTTEVSAALFFSIVDKQMGDLPAEAASDNEPRAWTADGQNDAVNWVFAFDNDAPTNSVVPERGTATRECPMTFVTPSLAEAWARRIGCRLPTISEWGAALEDEKAAVNGNVAQRGWNLRDASWTAQVNNVRSQQAGAEPAVRARLESGADPSKWMWFGREQYPGNAVWNASLTGAGGNAWNDGHLFFLPVQANDTRFGRKYYHLIGNAAEIVTKTPDGSDFAVIGGSAFSPPQLGYDKPATAKADGGWCDVGFRLVIAAPRIPLKDRLATVLQKPLFVPEP